uniref:Uncharacterized protein n=1 Tax=Octopus bimaculoides TaxID=37653 RepID=A0A0L8GL68_OCTBM
MLADDSLTGGQSINQAFISIYNCSKINNTEVHTHIYIRCYKHKQRYTNNTYILTFLHIHIHVLLHS